MTVSEHHTPHGPLQIQVATVMSPDLQRGFYINMLINEPRGCHSLQTPRPQMQQQTGEVGLTATPTQTSAFEALSSSQISVGASPRCPRSSLQWVGSHLAS